MAMNHHDTDYLESLRVSTRSALAQVLGNSPKELIYLDTPRHRNLGDSLIWLGSVQYLEDLGHRIAYHSDMGRFRDRDLSRVSDDATILLHGGGNFGDLYPLHDKFRRFILQQYPKRRIVMLPQSIYYSNDAEQKSAVDDYRQAANLTILLRESRSLNIAEQNFPDLDYRFCYDLALGANLSTEQVSRRDGVLTLARTDKEATKDNDWKQGSSVDWSWNRISALQWRFYTAIGAAFKRMPNTGQEMLYPASQYANMRLLDINIAAAVRQFSQAAAVATDRLHAHVLASLLGVPHVVVDNTYGKVSGIYSEYTGGFSTAHWADNWSEALSKADRLADGAVDQGDIK